MKQYYTQMEAAKKGIITPEMEIVAVKEDMGVELLRERVAQGVIAIPCNVRHTSISPEGIGMGPLPFPKSSIAASAPEIYSLARSTDFSKV